jgi:hypothetical protein
VYWIRVEYVTSRRADEEPHATRITAMRRSGSERAIFTFLLYAFTDALASG